MGKPQKQPLHSSLIPPPAAFPFPGTHQVFPGWEHPQAMSSAPALLFHPRFCVVDHLLGAFSGIWAGVASPPRFPTDKAPGPCKYKGGSSVPNQAPGPMCGVHSESRAASGTASQPAMGKLRHRTVTPQTVVGGSAVSIPRPGLRSETDQPRLVLPNLFHRACASRDHALVKPLEV